MPKNLREILAISLMVSLWGCATTPISTDLALDVPRSRVLNSSLLEKKEGYGQVIIKRDEGLFFSECNTRVFINGIPFAEIAPGEKVVFYMPEGEQMIAVEATMLICKGALVEIMAQVNRSRPSIFRISYGSNGDFHLQPTVF